MKHFVSLSALALCLGLSSGASAQGNLVVNGDFETPNPATPTKPFPGNISNVYCLPDKDNVKINQSNDLANWQAANWSNPDYYTTLSQRTLDPVTGASIYPPNNPNGSSYGAFTPIDFVAGGQRFYGCLGLKTYEKRVQNQNTILYSEYARGTLSTPLTQGKTYYAVLWAYNAGGSMVPSVTHIGMEILPGLGARTDFSTTCYAGNVCSSALFQPVQPNYPYTGAKGMYSQLTISSRGWTRVCDVFSPSVANLQSVLIGNFQQYTPTETSPYAFQYIDNVGIYEVPTGTTFVTTSAPITRFLSVQTLRFLELLISGPTLMATRFFLFLILLRYTLHLQLLPLIR